MKIVHLTLTPFQFESRLAKERNTALKAVPSATVTVVAVSRELPGHEAWPRTEVFRLRLRWNLPRRFGGLLVRYAEWFLRVRALLRRLEPIDVLHVHGLGTLPAGVLLARRAGARLVYDAHELETEAMGIQGLRRRLAKVLEQLLLPRVDAMLVVSESIANWYRRNRPPVPLELVRNAPPRRSAGPRTHPERDFRQRFGLAASDQLFVLQGGLTRGRGIEGLVSLFRARRDHRHLVFMGYGALAGEIDAEASRSDHIHFMDAVPPEQVTDWVSSADVGIFLLEAPCLSYEYALPNKLFEFLLAGLPVIVTPRVEMKRVVEDYRCGWVVEDIAAADALIQTLDAAAIAACGPGIAAFSDDFCWENEEPALLRAYGLATTAAPPRLPAHGGMP